MWYVGPAAEGKGWLLMQFLGISEKTQMLVKLFQGDFADNPMIYTDNFFSRHRDKRWLLICLQKYAINASH